MSLAFGLRGENSPDNPLAWTPELAAARLAGGLLPSVILMEGMEQEPRAGHSLGIRMSDNCIMLGGKYADLKPLQVELFNRLVVTSALGQRSVAELLEVVPSEHDYSDLRAALNSLGRRINRLTGQEVVDAEGKGAERTYNLRGIRFEDFKFGPRLEAGPYRGLVAYAVGAMAAFRGQQIDTGQVDAEDLHRPAVSLVRRGPKPQRPLKVTKVNLIREEPKRRIQSGPY